MWFTYPHVLSRTAFGLCKQIAHNRKFINADHFEGRLSRDYIVQQNRIKEDTVIAAANTLIKGAGRG